jgi:hypothetical protein
MTLQPRSAPYAPFATFEDTRPATYATRPRTGPVAPTPWPARQERLDELPEVDPIGPSRRPPQDRRASRTLRVAGLAVATLLALFALGLAASLLDAQRSGETVSSERAVAAVRG